LSAFDETLATTTAVDFSVSVSASASLLSWFLPLIASHGLFCRSLGAAFFFPFFFPFFFSSLFLKYALLWIPASHCQWR
jgi:hypothetical protein